MSTILGYLYNLAEKLKRSSHVYIQIIVTPHHLFHFRLQGVEK